MFMMKFRQTRDGFNFTLIPYDSSNAARLFVATDSIGNKMCVIKEHDVDEYNIKKRRLGPAAQQRIQEPFWSYLNAVPDRMFNLITDYLDTCTCHQVTVEHILINRSFVNVFTHILPSAKIVRFASTAIDSDIIQADLTKLFDSFLLSVRELALIKSGLETVVDDHFLTKFSSENTCTEDLSLTIEPQDGTQWSLFHLSHSISIARFATFEVPSLCIGTEFLVEQFRLRLAMTLFGSWKLKFHVTRQFTHHDFEHLEPSYQLFELVTDGGTQKGKLARTDKKKYADFTIDGNENPMMIVTIIRYS